MEREHAAVTLGKKHGKGKLCYDQDGTSYYDGEWVDDLKVTPPTLHTLAFTPSVCSPSERIT